MAYQITYTNTFKKEYQRCKKRGYDMSLLRQAITMLSEKCHLRPDWLLVWKQNDKKLILLFTNTGTHADLF